MGLIMKFKYETNRRASKSYHEIYFLTLNARGVIILAFFSYVFRLSMKLTLIVRALPRLDITYPLSRTRLIPASDIPPAWDRHRGKSLSCLEMPAQGGSEYQECLACIETFISLLVRKTFT